MIFGLRSILIAFCIIVYLNNSAECRKKNASVFNKFAFDISKRLGSRNENVFISPFSITSGLLMSYFGAKGQTAREMKNVLGLKGINDNTKLTIYRNYLNHLNRNNRRAKDFKLNMANRIFISNRVSINPTFQSLLRRNFKAGIQRLNFANRVRSANKINRWVRRETNNKIQNLAQPAMFNRKTALVLVNAIYFRATWKFKFNPRFTRKANFFLPNRRIKRVDMMASRFRLNCKFNSKRIGADVCELPYFGDKISMLLVLPRQGLDTRRVERRLNANSFRFVLRKLRRQLVNLELPKFKINFRRQLNDVLNKMGMVTPFSRKANFHKMILQRKPISISRVIHDAVISVDENGTEAAAATLVQIGIRSRGSMFRCNRPFIYIIYDKSSENILFMGKLVKP